MKLRNIVHYPDGLPEDVRRIAEAVHKWGTIVITKDMTVEKIPTPLDELVSRNMDLIEKLIDLDASREQKKDEPV